LRSRQYAQRFRSARVTGPPNILYDTGRVRPVRQDVKPNGKSFSSDSNMLFSGLDSDGNVPSKRGRRRVETAIVPVGAVQAFVSRRKTS